MTAIKIEGIDHAVLRVTDLEASVRFYRDGLGCPVYQRHDARQFVQMRLGDQLIDLIEVTGEFGRRWGGPPGDSGRNLDHLALRVVDFDEDAMTAHLEALGYKVGELRMIGGSKSLFVDDPDGNIIELKERPVYQAGKDISLSRT